MVGLEGAGKTTLLYRMKLGEVLDKAMAEGFNAETVQYKRIRLCTHNGANAGTSLGEGTMKHTMLNISSCTNHLVSSMPE